MGNIIGMMEGYTKVNGRKIEWKGRVNFFSQMENISKDNINMMKNMVKDFSGGMMERKYMLHGEMGTLLVKQYYIIQMDRKRKSIVVN